MDAKRPRRKVSRKRSRNAPSAETLRTRGSRRAPLLRAQHHDVYEDLALGPMARIGPLRPIESGTADRYRSPVRVGKWKDRRPRRTALQGNRLDRHLRQALRFFFKAPLGCGVPDGLHAEPFDLLEIGPWGIRGRHWVRR